MSRRHRVRMLPDGRWVCSARGCKFSGSWEAALGHVTGKEQREAA